MSNKIEFRIEITYFDTKGKLYTTATVNRKVRLTDEGKCNMNDVAAWIRGIRSESDLPEVKSWDGYILINCRTGWPILILP